MNYIYRPTPDGMRTVIRVLNQKGVVGVRHVKSPRSWLCPRVCKAQEALRAACRTP